MANIIKEFYENYMRTEKHIGGYDQATCAEIMADRETKLLEMLDEKGKTLYEGFVEAGGNLSYENASESFAKGFALGALLMEAILETKAEIFGK